VPGCGGFLLTGYVENLESYYKLDKEIVSFENTKELIEKLRYYIEHEEERQTIAQAGYIRTIKEHTYVQRFNDIFNKMSLPYDIKNNGNGKAIPGEVVEIN
jgi:spore maturation protein CgeB